ncbi:SAD2, partial [Symbiodinium sp. CCMP2456]
ELLQFGIFPQIRFGDVEMQLWQLDPEELLRELLSDCDSDSRPHQAAMELVEKLLLYRHKEVLLPLLQFSQLHLEAADQSDLAHANKEGALVLLGLMADHLVDLDPTQLPEGGEGKKQKKKGRNRPSQTVSIEELLARFVLPALASSAAFVRLRALWVSAAFARQ